MRWGERPLSALSILCYPAKGDLDDLEAILKGGAEKMREAGCVVLGGHSVSDDEIKFGYAVTGTVHPDRVRTNAGARAGDAVVFTKRLGTGVIGTALKRGIARDADVRQAAIESMLTLNRAACEAMAPFDVHGCTDVTGFGLVGHARELALASGVTLEIEAGCVRSCPAPWITRERERSRADLKNNREFAACAVEGSSELDALLYDPQTSGGLLVSLSENDAAAFERTYSGAYRIGRVLERGEKAVRIS